MHHLSSNSNPLAEPPSNCFKLRRDEKAPALHLSCVIGPTGLEQIIGQCPLGLGVAIDGRLDGPFIMARGEGGQWQQQSATQSEFVDLPLTKSNLQNLPPELRNRMYKYILRQEEQFLLTRPAHMCSQAHPEHHENVGLASLHHTCNELQIKAGHHISNSA